MDIYQSLIKNIVSVQTKMNLGSIKTLNLSNMNIDDSYCFELVKALKYNHTIIELNLSNNYIFYYGARAIFNMLEKNDTIRTLILDNNYIGTIPYILPNSELDTESRPNQLIETLIKSKLITTIDEYTLDTVKYFDKDNDMGYFYNGYYFLYKEPKISSMLKINTTLEKLHLCDNNYRSIEDLKYGLYYNKTVKELYLSDNNLIFNECNPNTTEFKNSITHLDLSGNSNHQYGAGKIYYDKLISSVIKNSTTITHLKLDNFKLGGDIYIVDAFNTNKSITHLSFKENNINLYIESIFSNPFLCSIDIRIDNPYTSGVNEDNIDIIISYLKNNNNLKELYISSNNLNENHMINLISALETNNTIQFLDIYNTNNSKLNIPRIESILEANRKVWIANHIFTIYQTTMLLPDVANIVVSYFYDYHNNTIVKEMYESILGDDFNANEYRDYLLNL
jgi:hypothetical protein